MRRRARDAQEEARFISNRDPWIVSPQSQISFVGSLAQAFACTPKSILTASCSFMYKLRVTQT